MHLFGTGSRPGSLRRTLATRVGVTFGLLGLLASGTATATAAPAPAPAVTVAPATAGEVPRPDHTVVVMMENKNRSSVIGSSKAPYINALARRGASMSESYGVTHPSQGNYVALFSGSQHGVTNDKCPQQLGSRANLGSQLTAAGLSFVGYAESMPRAGYTGCSSGRYQRKHNSWVDFSTTKASQNQPLSAMPKDFSKLPTVSFVTPNMCHDMHDCSVSTGDTWLKKNIEAYAHWARLHNSLLVLTFDENAGGTVNQITTVIVGQKVRPGEYAEWMDHYTLLRTIEDAYGLAPLGHAAEATPLRTIWTTSPAAVTGVANASFERGLGSWATSGSTASSKNFSHRGSRSARAGATTATRGDSILSQTVTVPKGKNVISVWWKGRCSDRASRAWATAVLKRNSSRTTSTLLPRTCATKGSWRKLSAKVTPGHSYTLQLVNHDDGQASTPNRTYFDDVRLS